MASVNVATFDPSTVPPTRSRARSVLVLNATYEPLRPVQLKRAMRLLALGRAVVHADDGSGRFLTNVTREQLWPYPQVIRLLKFVKVSYAKLHGPPTWSKQGVLNRDAKICGYCRSTDGTTVDHIKPRAQNGKSSWLNTVACCSKCNGRKADRTPAQAGMKLLATPYAPRRRQ